MVTYLGCGNYFKQKNKDWGWFKCVLLRSGAAKFLCVAIFEIILPFFQEYNIRGVKSLDFLNWCEIAEMMKNKEHLTQEGLDKIKKIKENMNKSRKIN